MLHRPYGPRGAESEDPEFWTDLTRSSDFLPEPGIVNPVLRSAQDFGNADAVPQPPERCLSRKAGIMRYCLYFLFHYTRR